MGEPTEPRATLEAEMERLRIRYVERLELNLTEIAQLAAEVSGSERDRRVLAELHHRLHKLAGTAGTFGFDAIGGRARQLEAMAQEWLESSLEGLDQAVWRSFIDDVKGLRIE